MSIIFRIFSGSISRSHERRVSAAKSGSCNNNPSCMTENYLKVARPTFHEGDRIFFPSLLPSVSGPRHVAYALHRWAMCWNTQYNQTENNASRFVRTDQAILDLTFLSPNKDSFKSLRFKFMSIATRTIWKICPLFICSSYAFVLHSSVHFSIQIEILEYMQYRILY